MMLIMIRKNKKMMEQVRLILNEYGEKAFEMAKNFVLQEKHKDKSVYEALRYFMEECWYDVQHPALLSLCCEAVGGNPEATTKIGAAIVLLAGAADVHDDIIDKSKIKNSKHTIFGKFGGATALLVGDALLFKGLMLLHEACESLQGKHRKQVLNIIKEAFFEIGNAEARETDLRHKKFDLAPEEYYSVIKMKAAVASATAKIGAILGGGTQEEVEILGHFGRTLGILMTIRDDFIDLFEPDEIVNRVKNECLPLPILYALQNEEKRNKIVELLVKDKIEEQETEEILNLIMDMEEVQELKRRMKMLIKEEERRINDLKKDKSKEIFRLLLQSTIEDL